MVSNEHLQERIRRRGQDDEAEIARRMRTAVAEIKEASKFEYHIESGTRDEDFAALLAIVRQARARLAAGP